MQDHCPAGSIGTAGVVRTPTSEVKFLDRGWFVGLLPGEFHSRISLTKHTFSRGRPSPPATQNNLAVNKKGGHNEYPGYCENVERC